MTAGVRPGPTVVPTAAVPVAGPGRLVPSLVLVLLVVVALGVRWLFVDVRSGDYRSFLDPWFQHLATHGFAGLADEFSNYNTPYLVLLWLATKLPVSQIVAIKLVSVLFDLLLASFAYAIVRELRPASRWWPVLVGGLILLLPTVVMNSSAWGQCDAIYASLSLGSLFFLLRRRPWLACALFGLAFAFKLQAIFLLPVLVAVLLVNRLRVRALVAVPLAFFAALLPAWVAGRGLLSQLAVYPAQITGGSGGGGALGDPARSGGGRAEGGNSGGGYRGAGGQGAPPDLGGGSRTPGGGGPDVSSNGGLFGLGGGTWTADTQHVLTSNAPTWYAWLPTDASASISTLGLALTAVVVAAIGFWLVRRGRALGSGDVIMLAATAAVVIPFLLPEMHERYFYLAEVLAVIAIAVDRRFVVVAVLLQVASLATYYQYLANTQLLPLGVSAAVVAVAVAAALALLVRRLRVRPAAAPS